MKEIILELKLIKEKNHLNVLAAANSFYLLLLIIPLSGMGINFYAINVTKILDIFGFGIIFLINSIFVVTRYLNNLKLTSDIVYKEVPLRNRKREFVKSLILTLFLLFISVTLIISSYGFVHLIIMKLKFKQVIILKMIEFIISFIIVLIVVSFVYKYSVPVLISFKQSFIISFYLTIVWFLISSVYQFIMRIIKDTIFDNEIYQVIMFISFLYVLNYVIILSFVYHYIKVKKWNNVKGIK
ncbi:MAG: hypothetical protein IKC22_06145 [Bacilli bacterium]|nr:hypothetical protein [Bacilli bacterium]